MVEILEDRWLPTAYFVSNLNDAGFGSLRQAVLDADAHPGVGGDTITFDPGVTGVITLTSGPLTLSDNVSILGPGAGLLSLSGNHATRVLAVTQGWTASVQGLTITDGNASAGGGIDNAGVLTLDGCTLSENQANPTAANLNANLPTGGGGAVLNETTGTLTLSSCTFNGNVANALNDTYDVFGGGLLNEGVAAVTSCIFTGNQALGGGGGSFFGGSSGGAIADFGGATLTVTGSTFTDNQAVGAGLGNFGLNSNVSPDAGMGGAIENDAGFDLNAPSTAVISDSTFSNNLAGVPTGDDQTGVLGNGGALDNQGIGATMTVEGCTISDNQSLGGPGAAGVGGGVMNYADGIFQLLDSTVSGNRTGSAGLGETSDGGGLYNLTATMTISDSIIDDNVVQAGPGGGNHNWSDWEILKGKPWAAASAASRAARSPSSGAPSAGTRLSAAPTPIWRAQRPSSGVGSSSPDEAAPYVIAGAALGGGICNGQATLTLIDSTVSDNIALAGSPSATSGGSAALGGGLENLRIATVVVIGSTITGNEAIGGTGPDGGGDAEGGGLDSSYNSTATIKYSNITGNFAVGGNGGSGPHGKDLGDNIAAGFYSIVGVLANDDSVFTIVVSPSLATLSASIVDVGRPAAANGSAPSPTTTAAPTFVPPLLAVVGSRCWADRRPLRTPRRARRRSIPCRPGWRTSRNASICRPNATFSPG